jgi:Kef-type K+ transport system membrane component KefB
MDTSLIVAAVLILAGWLALELGISSAITEIVAGVLLGYFIADVGKLDWLEFMAHFGLLGLMFMAGFEVDVRRLRTTWKSSAGIGVVSLAVPFAAVFIVCYYGFGLETKVAALAGIGLSTTSLALVYHTLRDRNLLGEPIGQTLLGGATVVDVLSMVALAILLGEAGWGTLVFLIFFVPTVIGLPQAGAWLFRRYKGNVVEFELRFILTLLIGMGFMATNVGVHPAIIGFAVGLILSELVQGHEELEEKLKGIVFSFFAPIFFLDAGTRLDVSLVDFGVIRMAAALFVVACGMKYLGTLLAARFLARTMGHFAGILFNYRLSFGIITATVGLEEGLIDVGLYSVILLVVMASAALPMILLGDRPTELDP